MTDREKLSCLKRKLHAEIQTSIKQEDSWLLITFDVSERGVVRISPDTTFEGFENSRELRRPRWRTLRNAKDFECIGYRYIVAGKLGMTILAKLVKDKNIPKGIVIHKSAIQEWLPAMGEIKPVLNSVKGFINPNSPEHKRLAAKRLGSATRKRLKDGKSCHFCNSKENLTLHHLVRREVGGATEEENLLVVCRDCHDKIHEKEIDDVELVLEVSAKRFQNLIAQVFEDNSESGAEKA